MRFIALFISLIFISCEMGEYGAKQRVAELQSDHDTCSSYGFTSGTDQYANCRMLLDQDRKQRKAQAYNQMGNMGKCLLGQSGYQTYPSTLGQALGNC